VPGPDAALNLTLNGLPLGRGTARLTQYRIDAEHSNSYEAWKRMGSPQSPTPEQYKELEKAGKLVRLGASQKVPVQDGAAALQFNLPRQAVDLLVLEWK
jgi:xylan 1,4-beta-xylosidase